MSGEYESQGLKEARNKRLKLIKVTRYKLQGYVRAEFCRLSTGSNTPKDDTVKSGFQPDTLIQVTGSRLHSTEQRAEGLRIFVS
ncbi:MAG: hypothetical protein AMS27_14240 [Bacteroides sp. SM23_62_1]|nr:MAG: hypothetical protein AMS27_14240 [Bacteroides sp. SM23_62_1]